MKKWSVGRPDRKTVSDLTIKCGVSTLTAAVLSSRGFSSPDDVFKNYQVNELSDPFLIKDMQLAADTINNAIECGSKICVYGDYDCDGIMSTVMLYSYLIEAGADAIFYIPERSEGYGLNKSAVKKISDNGVELIITVDNGISAIDEAEYVYEVGMKLVITDHHQTGDKLPKAEAVVDPHRNDCFSPFKLLCGAGLVLKLIAALDGGDYTMALEQFGDLAAIATVADIVSLTEENRFITAYGMQLIENTDRPALEALKEVCGLSGKKIDTSSIGFGLAPRINASGRFGSPLTAAKLFLSEDPDEINEIAEKLNMLNNQRKDTEAEIMNEIYKMIDDNPRIIRERVINLSGINWHHGVIGIVASRISERFGKPCFISSECDGELRGSARAFGDFSVFSALTYCSAALEKFGGHYGAGGYTIKPGKFHEFNSLLQEYALNNHKIMPALELKADSPVSPSEITVQNVKSLSLLEPFGTNNEKPLFFIENAIVNDIIPLSGGTHVKLRLKFGFTNLDALIFRTSPSELCISKGESCNLIVSLDINSYNGKESVSVIVKDYRSSIVEQSKYFAALNAFEAFIRSEALPVNYYRSMCPVREEVVEIYLKIPYDGINSDTLYFGLKNPKINYCKFSAAVEALIQLNLISYTSADNKLYRIKAEKKVNLQSAPVLKELAEKLK